jgi:xanthine dehydrogenase accessory factor
MEMNLVDESRSILSNPRDVPSIRSKLIEQVHRKNAPNASGMICSGKQTVILLQLTSDDAATISAFADIVGKTERAILNITDQGIALRPDSPSELISFTQDGRHFDYRERLGAGDDIFIIGGGHCSLALSELASKLGFRVSIFDDRPALNTIAKNRFAHEVAIIDSYEKIGDLILEGNDTYVVVMTVGFRTDALVVRRLAGRNFRYFGVLGSRAKMATLLRELEREGVPREHLERIRTPIGLPINSRTPEEIAVSIAAEIVAIRNGAIDQP